MLKTTSLETAKALKELGFPQDTEFYWSVLGNGWTHYRKPNLIGKTWRKQTRSTKVVYAAPTSDDIMAGFPAGKWELVRTFGGYRLNYMDKKIFYLDLSEGDKNVPDLFATMWIWLKKEGLL